MQGAKRARTDTKVAAVEQAQNFVNENTKVQNFVNENAKKQDRRPNRSEAQTSKSPEMWAHRRETAQQLGSNSAKNRAKSKKAGAKKNEKTPSKNRSKQRREAEAKSWQRSSWSRTEQRRKLESG